MLHEAHRERGVPTVHVGDVVGGGNVESFHVQQVQAVAYELVVGFCVRLLGQVEFIKVVECEEVLVAVSLQYFAFKEFQLFGF